MELDDNDKDAELSSDDDKQKDNEDVFGPLRVNPTSSSSRAPSEAPPASSDSEQDMAALTAIDKDDLFDIDALLAEEEEMMTGRANAAGSHVASSNSNNNKQSILPGAVVMKGGKDDDFMFDEEEEAIWAEMHGINDDPSVAQRQSSVVNANKSKPNSESMYDDDDAWDVLNEIEREQGQQSRPGVIQDKTGAVQGTEDSSVVKKLADSAVTAPKSLVSNDDDWDDMYV